MKSLSHPSKHAGRERGKDLSTVHVSPCGQQFRRRRMIAYSRKSTRHLYGSNPEIRHGTRRYSAVGSGIVPMPSYQLTRVADPADETCRRCLEILLPPFNIIGCHHCDRIQHAGGLYIRIRLGKSSQFRFCKACFLGSRLLIRTDCVRDNQYTQCQHNLFHCLLPFAVFPRIPGSLRSFTNIGGGRKRKPPPMHRKRRLREPVKTHQRRRSCLGQQYLSLRLYKRSSQAFLRRFPCPRSAESLRFPCGKSVSLRRFEFTPISPW